MLLVALMHLLRRLAHQAECDDWFSRPENTGILQAERDSWSLEGELGTARGPTRACQVVPLTKQGT